MYCVRNTVLTYIQQILFCSVVLLLDLGNDFLMQLQRYTHTCTVGQPCSFCSFSSVQRKVVE
jgi:hypothetical protein